MAGRTFPGSRGCVSAVLTDVRPSQAGVADARAARPASLSPATGSPRRACAEGRAGVSPGSPRAALRPRRPCAGGGARRARAPKASKPDSTSGAGRGPTAPQRHPLRPGTRRESRARFPRSLPRAIYVAAAQLKGRAPIFFAHLGYRRRGEPLSEVEANKSYYRMARSLEKPTRRAIRLTECTSASAYRASSRRRT